MTQTPPRIAKNSMSMRLDLQPGEAIDRGRRFRFTWNGEAYPAYEGDTIVSALAACGERVFSRSFKYHRPRGLLTASFLDPGCLVQVGDEPNVRGAHRSVEPGMVVSPQNVWPSLRFDVKSANGAFDRFFSAGFYYKTFIKPQRLWPAYRRVLRRFSAGGVVSPDSPPVKIPELPVVDHPALFYGRTPGIVDYSEDVTSKDLLSAEKEGYDSIELVKRYTTVTMGAAQGKLETVNSVAIMAAATSRTVEDTGTTVWRPPFSPITLGALAGRIFEPVRYSPMQPWHERHGAKPLVAGAWIRPDHYGDPASEVRNVRENVGIIDVTPLGKFDLRGPDVPELLDMLYVNRWASLDVGRVRYGVMCLEDGVVFDDGVTGRLGPNRYIMTATSSGADTVWEWIDNWLQTAHPEWRIHFAPVTTAYASINVAGPKSRELLLRLTEGVDLSPDAFPYMRVRTGRIAGVDDCFMWRIGFTGELSYEIHVPAAYGLHVWEALMERGADLGVGPFGVEAQRILRLENGHLIIGQDTDGLTGAYAAGLAWAVKLDKDDFAGKPELVWQSERDDYHRLVGLQPHDGSVVPPEASQIVEGEKRIVGRITSSRMSPTLGRSICLGFVAPHLAGPGTTVTVRLPDGERIPARVMEHHAHFDPEGVRQRG